MIKLLLAGYCTQRPGGKEVFVRNLVASLPKDEFQVCVLSFDSPLQSVRKEFEARAIRLFEPQHHPFLRKKEVDVHAVADAVGPIDIIHCNGTLDTWRWLKGAKDIGIPVRIFHGHNPVQKYGGLLRNLYVRHYMIPLLSRYATHCVFCSQYVKDQWTRLGSHSTIPCDVKHCGIDFSPFGNAPHSLHASLGMPNDSLVFGHVGRFTRQKNHTFLIEIFKEIAAREPRAYFLLVGSGHWESQVRRHIARLGLKDRVILTGHRNDIPDLLATMNVFVLPSFFEGMPLVSVEALAASIPSLCSTPTGISQETDLLPGMIQSLSLDDSAERWAEAAIAKAKETFPPQEECLKAVRNSQFELSRVTQVFADYYRNCLVGCSDVFRAH